MPRPQFIKTYTETQPTEGQFYMFQNGAMVPVSPRPVTICDFYTDVNTNDFALTQNIWTKFSQMSQPFTVSINSVGDITIDEVNMRITYTGASPKLLNIWAIINTKKGSGSANEKNIAYRWYQNGVGVGPIRNSRNALDDISIVTGCGRLLFNQNDFIEPYLCNLENNDPVLVTNFSINITEQPTTTIL